MRVEPIVYEDFLPRSAAGIFQSNLSGEGTRHNDQEGTAYDAAWLSGAIGRDVLDPFALYCYSEAGPSITSDCCTDSASDRACGPTCTHPLRVSCGVP
ncbi:hypothetical protein GCM10011579_022130 [Streptomyces albiflavescens]|uniref:2-oxoadipate dioxygenase/decarboxylase n=1 Tax=Streptomyces albiflavescens TaxID=1623582 RepID=A0A918D275_9ACTN|nr:hypothetical protein GCM10011579_022130 [Streptomyces albiflavescens]